MNELRLDVPRLNPVPFIIADLVLLGAAALIGWLSPAPINPAALGAIALCVAVGAVVLLYPFVVNHSRRQEESLQDRANQIEALARTVSAAAEQISIAVSNLPAIADSSARQLKAAEQLPAALKEQLAGLQQQLAATAHEENAALRHELDTLRAAETDKLAAALDGLNRATADLGRLEKLGAQHSATLDLAIAQMPRLADAFGQQASEALRRETQSAIKALNDAAAEAGRALASATDEARVAFDRGVRDAVRHLAIQATSNPPFPAHTLTRPIKEEATPPLAPSAPVKAAADATAPLAQATTALIDDADLDEPATPAARAEETPPTAPAGEKSAAPQRAAAAPEAATAPAPEAAAEPEPSAPEPASEAEPASAAEPALSHDGYTRLVATAYIGIGNRLFIRGDGPGLRPDKGVPLQFVSIGKWRWESAELLFPVKAKLYKNDQVECVALGELTLEPGHHHEVTATF